MINPSLMIQLLIEKCWALWAAIVLVVITILSLTPLAELPTVPGSDKTHHFIAYASLMLPVALRRPRYWFGMMLFFIAYSGGIELVQPYVNRYGEWLDLLANTVGLFCGLLLSVVISKVWPQTLAWRQTTLSSANK